MKKIYLVLIALTITSFGFGQIISQYVETESGTAPKGIEIWNNTAATLNFATNNLVIQQGTNGAAPTTRVTVSTGTLASGSVIVIGTSGTLATVTGANGSTFTTFAFDFNGNDALVVRYGGVVTDTFGTPGNDPGASGWSGSGVSTANQNIALNTGITTTGGAFTNPSLRFSTINSTPSASGAAGVAGFGIPPVTACTPPTTQATAYNTTSITTTSGTLNWTRGNGTAGVLVVMRNSAITAVDPTSGNNTYTASSTYGAGGSTTGTGNFVVYKGTGTSVNVTGLTQNTNYSVAVYEYNTTGTCYNTTELTGSFNTLCTAVSALPFTENFEGGVVPPNCWTTYRGTNNLGTFQDWKISGAGEGRSGGLSALVSFEPVTVGQTSEDWLVTPALNFSLTSNNILNFWTKNGLMGDQGSTLSVRVSTTSQTDRASFTTVATFNESALAYVLRTVDLSAYSNASLYIAFVMTQNDADAWYLDDVSVAGSCSSPTTQASAFNATSINAAAGSATLNWTRGNGNNVLVVARAGSPVTTDPTSGVSYTGNASFGSGDQIGTGNFVVYNGPASSANIGNLLQNTTYHVAIYEYNTTGICYNLTQLTGNFLVPCATVPALTFTEGFEGQTIPACWTTFRGVNGLGTIQDWQVNSNAANSGSYSAYLQYEDGSSGTSQDWLVSLPIDLTSVPNGQLTFFTRDGLIDQFTSSYTVRISTTSQTTPGAFTTVATYVENPAAPNYIGNSYNQKTIDLSAYSNQTVYIAFVMEQDLQNGGDDWYLDDIAVTIPAVSTNSDIVEAGFDEPDNINYSAFSATSGLTTTNAIKIGEFTVRDGGATPDTDAVATTLTGVSFTVQNFGNMAALALFDGTTNLAEVTSVAATTAFSSLSLVAADNGTKSFDVYATFKSVVTDNAQIQLTMASATAAATGSTFALANAGGAQTSVVGDDNKIEVTATTLRFSQQPPTNTDVNAVMTPAPTVRAVDSNLNLDLDYVTTFSLSTTGTFAGTATTSATPLAGVATFNNLRFSTVGTGFTMTTVSPLTNATSTAFNILALPTFGWQIGMANQVYTIDFENTVINVNNGPYAGTGFTSNPNTGQLNSSAWASTGMSEGALAFGGSRTTGDYARGTSTGNESGGGFYRFDIGGGNFTFGVQPSSADYNPGTTTLRAQNQTGQTVTSITFSYVVYVNNNENRNNTFNFSYSDNNTAYVTVPSLDITSGLIGDSAGFVANTKTITINSLNISDGAFVYLRWNTTNPGGSGSMDEFGLDDISVVFNPLIVDTNSNIVATSFDAPDNINYIAYTAASGLTTSNAIKIGEFSIQDGGDTLTDDDNTATVLTDVSFNVLNSGNLAALAIFDGGTNVSEITNVSTSNAFSGLTLTATDNSSKVFSVYATFKPIVTDNQQVQLTISAATASLTSSGFAAADAGGATTSVVGDDNRIEVTATTFRFVQQPSDVNLSDVMVPSVTVNATDANTNIDADFAGSVTLTTTGTFSGSATTTVTAAAGLASFDNLAFSTTGTFTLTATSVGLTNSVPSNAFVVSPATKSIWYEPFTDNTQYDVTLGGEGSGANGDYFQITDGSNINKTYTGNIGNFFAAQDIDGGGWAGSATPSQLTWTGINIERYTSLNFSGKFASEGGGIDAADFVKVEYQIDGTGWVNLIAFEGPGGSNNDFMEDTDFDGTGEGATLTSAFQNFTKSLPSGGAILDLRITISVDSGTEDIALEDFRLAGLGTVFPGNATTGFGGVVGNSTLEVDASSGSVVNFEFNRGTDNFNDYMVIYIDSKAGGIATTANLTDTGDDGRKAISGFAGGTNRSTITFPPGFRPDYAISMNNGFAGLFEIVPNGSHTFIQTASLSPTGNVGASTYTFNINFGNIQSEPGLESFKFLATYLNGGNAFRSNESIGRNTAGTSNPGYAPFEMETYYEVASALQGGKAPSQAAGNWTADGSWLNGNPPLATDAITINNAIDQNIDVTVSNGMVVNGTLSILPTYTLSTAGGISGTGTLDVSGKFSITEGGFTNISPTYNPGGTLEYKDVVAVYNRFNEWTLGAAPSNVVVDNTDLDMTNLSINPNGTEDFNVGNNLTLLNGGSMTIAAVKSVTVGNTIANNGGTVNLNSNSTRYSSLIAGNVSGNGTFNYNRHINGQPGVGVGTGANDLISPPFSGQTFGDFAAANTNLTSNPNNTNQKRFGPFSKTTGTYLSWDTTVNGASILEAGVGYRSATNNNGQLLFTGTANTGIVNNNIVNAGPQFAPYNLIGNPYPSYLNVRAFLEYEVASGISNIDLMQNPTKAIYGYDGDASGTGGDGWVIYNLNTATDVNIAPGQGFLVTADIASVAAYDIQFAPSMRRVDAVDDFVPGRMAEENNVHLRLQAAIGTSNFKTDFYFNDNSTSGLDSGYDAGVFGSNAASKSIYSHLVEDNTGVDMAIQSLAFNALGSDIIVPLGINVSQGEQVTVSIAESTLPANIDVYLEDAVNSAFTLLNVNEYTFTPNTNLTDTGRFYLRFTDRTLSTDTADLDKLQIYSLEQTVHINGLLNASTTVNIFDIQGRKVLTTVLKSGTTNNSIDVSKMSTGVYIVKLTNGTQEKTQKVIIK